eukprot:TRINITY_DN91738_c0_g1_i2.p1 TRINITY_DN91738_c0_g1~~TRINITY_DN91738_c0_g1_i2.p1  ORF type:complete len:738 (-),score=130.63 TRINITY_DN91738_c0_g1_i2:72-2285(-)
MSLKTRLIACFILAAAVISGDVRDQERIPVGKLKPDETVCAVLYTTTYVDLDPKDERRKDLRAQNLDSMMQKFPYIRLMKTLHWRKNWDTVRRFFEVLGLPVHMKSLDTTFTGANRGKLSHWAALLLAAAWQVRFKHQCMALLEDDVQLPDNFNSSFRLMSLPIHRPYVMKFGPWGEGYVFNFEAASRFLTLAMQEGIAQSNDWFIINNIDAQVVIAGHGPKIKVLVQPNKGNIAASPPVAQADFNYTSKPWYEGLQILLNAFQDEHETDLVHVAHRLAFSSNQPSSGGGHESIKSGATSSPTVRSQVPSALPGTGQSQVAAAAVAALQDAAVTGNRSGALGSGTREAPSLLQGSPVCFAVPWRLIFLSVTILSISWVLTGYWSSGPVVITEIISYLALLASISYTLKFLFMSCAFAYPKFVTAAHFLLSGSFGLALNCCTKSLIIPTCQEFMTILLPVSVTFAVSVLMTNTALNYCSISYVQMVGSTTPIISAGMTVIMGMPFTRWLFLQTVVVAMGATLSLRGTTDVSWLGTALAFGANVLRAFKGTLQQNTMTGSLKEKYTPGTLFTWTCFTSAPAMFVFSLLTEGRQPWKSLATTTSPTRLFFALLVSCLNAVGLNLFGLILTKEVGAVGMQIVGQMTTMLAFVGGIVFFGEIATVLKITGLLVVMYGAGMYQRWNLQLKKEIEASRWCKAKATDREPRPTVVAGVPSKASISDGVAQDDPEAAEESSLVKRS